MFNGRTAVHEYGLDLCNGKFRVLTQKVRYGTTVGQLIKKYCQWYACSCKNRLAVADFRVDRNVFGEIHNQGEEADER